MIKTTNFFDSLCKNARHNSILVMKVDGTILEVNQAFLNSFGYKEDDIILKNFSLLFTEEDKKTNRPQRELQTALTEGSGSDDNFLVQKSGKSVWVNGESILVTDEEVTYIVKIIHNIEAQKQLERFLLQSNDFITDILDSITDRGLIIIDSSLKVIKVNQVFLDMFDLTKPPAEDSRISGVGHHFWNSPAAKDLLRDILVKEQPANGLVLSYLTRTDEKKTIEVTSKYLHTHDTEKRILLSLKPL